MEKLTAEEKQQLIKLHKTERDKRICDRIKAVLLRSDGYTLEQIARILLLSPEAIRKQLTD